MSSTFCKEFFFFSSKPFLILIFFNFKFQFTLVYLNLYILLISNKTKIFFKTSICFKVGSTQNLKFFHKWSRIFLTHWFWFDVNPIPRCPNISKKLKLK